MEKNEKLLAQTDEEIIIKSLDREFSGVERSDTPLSKDRPCSNIFCGKTEGRCWLVVSDNTKDKDEPLCDRCATQEAYERSDLFDVLRDFMRDARKDEHKEARAATAKEIFDLDDELKQILGNVDGKLTIGECCVKIKEIGERRQALREKYGVE